MLSFGEIGQICDQDREAPIEARQEGWPKRKSYSYVDVEGCGRSKRSLNKLRTILEGYLKRWLL